MEGTKVKTNVGWKLDNSYARLPKMFYSKQNPSNVRDPKLIILNHPLAEDLKLNSKSLEGEDGIRIFSGNSIPEGSLPIAQAYAGHQFGYFSMLGDGRAILLGEQVTSENTRFDIQLKGSGKTPYSRGGDGRAAFGPMLREYIISEAMYGLGIPTTRSLAVVTTGETVIRENLLKGAILTRVAASHIRVATFQYVSEYGDVEELKALADYTLKRHFPEGNVNENKYLFLLQEVIKRQAYLIAKWQLVGFIHGVMNTDNMSICGETIDYGPCAFMDTYDPATVFSSIDREGRYAYGNQPYMGGWNLARFAETLLPLLHEEQDKAVELAQGAVSEFKKLYKNYWLSGMRGKLGLFNEESEDEVLIEELLNMMKKYQADYTNTFNALTFESFDDIHMFKENEFTIWYKIFVKRQKYQDKSKDDVLALMKNSNPAIIPRNHRVEEALEAAEKGDYEVMRKFLNVLSNPYAHSNEQAEYMSLPKKTNCKYKTFCGT